MLCSGPKNTYHSQESARAALVRSLRSALLVMPCGTPVVLAHVIQAGNSHCDLFTCSVYVVAIVQQVLCHLHGC